MHIVVYIHTVYSKEDKHLGAGSSTPNMDSQAGQSKLFSTKLTRLHGAQSELLLPANVKHYVDTCFAHMRTRRH